MFINKLTSILLFTPFARVALAAPAPSDRALTEPTPTGDARASVCTEGVSASRQHPAAYAINDYAIVTADVTANDDGFASYALEQDWFAEHFVSGPHVRAIYIEQGSPDGTFRLTEFAGHELHPQERALRCLQVPVHLQCQRQVQRLLRLVR